MIDFNLVTSLLPSFGQAALRTIWLVLMSTFIGVLIGFGINALRVFGGGGSRYAVTVYTSVWRFTPFLAQLFVVYFGLPSLGMSLTPFQAAAITLAFYSSAYFAEIFRACWDTIPVGQLEAAVVMGLSRAKAFRHIEMPQALAMSVPLLANQMILVLKESALASVITYPELTMTTGRIVAERFAYVEPYVMLAVSYWLMTLVIATLGKYFSLRFPTLNRGHK